MTQYEIVSISIALLAFVVAICGLLFHSLQVKKATKANLISQQIERGNAIMHFSNRYHEITKDHVISEKFDDAIWCFNYWGLLAIEFYFFHYSVIPHFIFSLWMLELSDHFASEKKEIIKKSQTQFLSTYSTVYPEMIQFFRRIYEIASTDDYSSSRHKSIARFVEEWKAENPPSNSY